MKKLTILFLSFILCGCTVPKIFLKNQAIINIESDLTFEYREVVNLYDLVNITDGTFITENSVIDTSKLGEQNISFEYKDINSKKGSYEFKINVVDSTNPIVFASKQYVTAKGKDIDLISKPVCGDNYTREMKCEIIGEYDVNSIGEYPIKITTTDDAGNYTEVESKVVVKDKINSSITTPIYMKDFISKYKNSNTLVGIDVSKWQGTIDWNKVKDSGVEFVFIRIGYGHDDGEMVIDKTFKENLKGAKDAGLLVGIYFYSYAKNTIEAKEQASWIIDTLNGELLDLPIAFDWEIWNRFMSYKINFNDLNDIAVSFMSEIERNGYKSMNYGSATYFRQVWTTEKYPTWLAYYTDNNTYEKKYYVWQRTSSGKVNGINGYVDLNVLYKN